jgi:HEPN domain-containing protein
MHREAQVLYERGLDDEGAADILLAGAGADAIVGFHCQQAVEKYLKAVLVERGINVPKTHDLVFLQQTLERAGFTLPAGFSRLQELQPFAVAERYEDTGAGNSISSVDARQLVADVRAWADSELGL